MPQSIVWAKLPAPFQSLLAAHLPLSPGALCNGAFAPSGRCLRPVRYACHVIQDQGRRSVPPCSWRSASWLAGCAVYLKHAVKTRRGAAFTAIAIKRLAERLGIAFPGSSQKTEFKAR
ncbi:hypothetical protein GCM10027514_02110 [Azotobacter armeniacus]